MLEKTAKALTRKPKLVLAIAVAVLVLCIFGSAATRINYDILTYLPPDLDSSQGEQLLEEPFHMAATTMLIVEDMPPEYTNSLRREIEEVPGVTSALWLSSIAGVQIPRDFLPEELADMFFSGDATMMIVQYDSPGASSETMEAISQVRKLCNEKCFLAGFSVVIKDTKDLVDQELPLYVGLAVLLSLIVMAATMESWLLPAAFLLSIGMAILYNFGTNIFLGEISYITKAIAAVLQLGVTMDYSIFLYHRYMEERDRYEDKRDAMTQAIAAAFRSLSGSSATTIAGFLALCFMQMTLGKNIGLVMAKGVVLGIATVIFVLPALVLIFDKQIVKYAHRPYLPSMHAVNAFVLRHRRAFVALTLLLIAPAWYSQKHTRMYYKLDESLPRDLPSIISNEKLKTDFDMAVSHFIVLRDDLTPAEMNDIETRMDAVPGVTSVLSYHKMLGTGIPDFFVPEDVRDILKQGGYQLMMVNSNREPATDEVAEQLTQMQAILDEYDPNAMITGEGAMYRDLIETMNVDIMVTNIISIIAIFVIIALVFKSITIPAVLVATIELAIMINQGLSYFTGAQVCFIAPCIISCIQLGATVDYAILMTSRFQDELRAGKNRLEAIQIAADSSDASVITSALVLFAATLGVSFVSSIDLIGAICTMLARGALVSALVSIFLMPAVLCVCEPLFAKTSLHWREEPPVRKKQVPHRAGAL